MLVSGQITMMGCSECTYQLYAVFEAKEDDELCGYELWGDLTCEV